MTFPLSIHPALPASPRLLDGFREALRPWCRSLFDAESGGFRQSEAIGPNVLASTDVVWLRYAAGEDDLGAPFPDRLIRYLQGVQDPATGRVAHDPGPGGQLHGDGHALWQTARALRLLGGELLHPPRHLLALASPEALSRWFASFDWGPGGSGNHHEVLGLAPLLASRPASDLVAAVLDQLGRQQDPRRGTWPRGAPAGISRTFAYTALHAAAGRVPDRASGIVDAVLALQRDNGLWDVERPHFHTMDAAYLLVRLPPQLGHRQADAVDALWRLAGATRRLVAEQAAAYAINPHAVLALTHTLGLLQEAFPDAFPSKPRFRFDWDDLSQYACAALAATVDAPRGISETPAP